MTDYYRLIVPKTSVIMKIIYCTLFALLFCYCGTLFGQREIHPGALWPDEDGVHINAHGGGILWHKGRYYWFGEHKCDTTSSAMVGVTCYSSRDLVQWKNEGVALSVEDDPTSPITRGCILERPKVIYCKQTKLFVMWFHLEIKGRGYNEARAGVAVSESPTGPYRFLRSGRVNPNCFPSNMNRQERISLQRLNPAEYKEWWTPEWRKAVEQGLFVKRDMPTGQMARDMTLYVDDDGKAYHIFSSEENLTLQIAELSDGYTYHTGRYVRMAPGDQNEAPAIFKHEGVYWMITSGCTGWAPNEARMYSSTSIWGPWERHPNPCVGPGKDKTFGGQSTYILPVHGKKNFYIFMADIWRPKHPSDARYIWLPIRYDSEGTPIVEWKDSWSL